MSDTSIIMLCLWLCSSSLGHLKKFLF